MEMSGKRAVIFTLTALVLILFFSGVSLVADTYDPENLVINLRLDSMNSFIGNVRSDASRALYTTGYRGMIGMLQHVEETGQYVDDVDQRMSELVLDGNYEGEAVYVMENNTLTDWIAKVHEQGQKIGVDIDMQVTDITVIQSDPWTVRIVADVHTTMQDMKGLASWEFDSQMAAEISIEGLNDPIFINNTGNQVSRIINRTTYDFSTIAELRDHMQNGYYVAFTGAPSYLKCLEGDLSADPNGIESLVDKAALQLVLPVDPLLSNVDYLYFDADSSTTYGITGMNPLFRLDNRSSLGTSHLELYNVSSRAYP